MNREEIKRLLDEIITRDFPKLKGTEMYCISNTSCELAWVYPGFNVIYLERYFAEHATKEQVESVLKHELVHLLGFVEHNTTFYNYCSKVGGAVQIGASFMNCLDLKNKYVKKNLRQILKV